MNYTRIIQLNLTDVANHLNLQGKDDKQELQVHPLNLTILLICLRKGVLDLLGQLLKDSLDGFNKRTF